MTQIDEATLNKVCAAINGKPELHIKLGGSLLPLVSLVVNAYEAARAPRTITMEELERAVAAYSFAIPEEDRPQNIYESGIIASLETLGITVEG